MKELEVRFILLSSCIFSIVDSWLFGDTATTVSPSKDFETTRRSSRYGDTKKSFSYGYSQQSSLSENDEKDSERGSHVYSTFNHEKRDLLYSSKFTDSDDQPHRKIYVYYPWQQYSSIQSCPSHCVPKLYYWDNEGIARDQRIEHESQPVYQQWIVENHYSSDDISHNHRSEKKDCPCPCKCPPSNCPGQKDERDDINNRFQGRSQKQTRLSATTESKNLKSSTATPSVENSTTSGHKKLMLIKEKFEKAAQSAANTELTKSAVVAIWVCGILSVILVVVGIVSVRALLISKAKAKRREKSEKPDASSCYYQPYYM